MTLFDQAIKLTLYLTSSGLDIKSAATVAEKRFTTPKQTIIKYIQNAQL